MIDPMQKIHLWKEKTEVWTVLLGITPLANVVSTSVRRNHVASTLIRRHFYMPV